MNSFKDNVELCSVVCVNQRPTVVRNRERTEDDKLQLHLELAHRRTDRRVVEEEESVICFSRHSSQSTRRAVSALTPRPALNHCSISYNRLRWFQHITRLCVHSVCQLWGCQGHAVYHQAPFDWLMLYSCKDLSSFCCFIKLSPNNIRPRFV